MSEMDTEHEGTLQQASSGWYYVECSCYWKSSRNLNPETEASRDAPIVVNSILGLLVHRAISGSSWRVCRYG